MYEFSASVARITIEGTQVRGTGFLVADDLVATALHVVADKKTKPPTFFSGLIHLDFRGQKTDALVLDGSWNQAADCVLLRCQTPPVCTPIPLRELRNSDDVYKTHGFPDAQPVDGLTMEGKVREYAAQLTDFYAMQSSSYQPVLQLFCQECASGDGAPVRGLSGAPVMVGGAAVGLMRFALMQRGLTVAGTLYACSAKDIVALCPERLSLRPPLAPVIVLTSEQTSELTELFVHAFNDNPEDLRRIVKFSLGIVPDENMSSKKDLKEIVAYLLLTFVQRRPGTIDMLLRGALMARPQDEKLLEFSRAHFSEVSQPLDEEALVQTIQRGLIEVAGMRQTSKVHQIIGSYRSDFEKTREQIDILAKYKELHNCLHQVQKSLLSITTDIGYLETSKVSPRILEEHASNLKTWAAKARAQIAGLATEEVEKDWIDELDACGDDIRTTTILSAPAPDREKVLDVPQRLESLLVQSAHINLFLFSAAKTVQLDNFADTMETVIQLVGDEVPEQTLTRLRSGSAAVGVLRSRLAGMVAEHNEWQILNTLLEGAKMSPKHWPQAKIPSWKQFKAKLIGLCDIYPKEEWSKGLKAMIAPWLGDAPAEPRIPGIIQEIDNQFWAFKRAFADRFFEVDSELNALCAKVTQLAAPLNALLSTE